MKICIDAGHNHSGWDTGAQGNGLKEQDITWLIADKARQLLQNAGVTVVMTREYNEQNLGSNTNSSLKKRVEICNANGCDCFVSIHCNAHSNEGAYGTEVLVPGRGGQAEQLANKVLSRIIQQLPMCTRGVKEGPLYVLKYTNCPAILVETGFITNKVDNNQLKERYDEFASAIVSGVLQHYNYAVPERHSFDNTVNQMILDGATAIENMQFWERTLAAVPKEVRIMIERYQEFYQKAKRK